MITQFRAKFTHDQGFAMPMVLGIILFFAIVVAGLAPMIQSQIRYVILNEDRLMAKYMAEAGVKMAAREVYDLLLDETAAIQVQPSAISSQSNITGSLLGSGGLSYTYSYQYIPGTNNPRDPERIEMIATATSHNITVTSTAWMVFSSHNVPGNRSPDLIDLIQSANSTSDKNCYYYLNSSQYNTRPWLIDNDDGRDYGAPQNPNNKNYILFDNDLNESSPEIRLDYNVEFTKTTGSGGVGVIYGADADDTAYSFNAYCVKFNNDRQAFSVTKFHKTATDGLGKDPQEIFILNTKLNSSAIDPNCIKTDQAVFQPVGIDNFGNDLGNCTITYTNLKTAMQNAGKNFDPATALEYTITVKTKWDTVTVHPNASQSYQEQRLRHIIELNGVEVLNFVDFSDVNPTTAGGNSGPYPINPTINLADPSVQVRSGLRVVNTTSAKFFNSNLVSGGTEEVDGIRQIIWKQ